MPAATSTSPADSITRVAEPSPAKDVLEPLLHGQAGQPAMQETDTADHRRPRAARTDRVNLGTNQSPHAWADTPRSC
jgi:hypothetical protein